MSDILSGDRPPAPPELLAAWHARAFAAADIAAAPWTAAMWPSADAAPHLWLSQTYASNASARPSPGCARVDPPLAGLALARIIAGEAELLTIAIAPEAQGRGLGGALMNALLGQLGQQSVFRLFLEVAETNEKALSLYHRFGFIQIGQRPRYYRRPTSPAVNALVLAIDL